MIIAHNVAGQMKCVVVCSRDDIESEDVLNGHHGSLISIASPGERPADPMSKFDHRIFLNFDDVEPNKPSSFQYQAMCPCQAKRVAAFVSHLMNPKDINEIMCCQCEAGISRSAGVAVAILDYFSPRHTLRLNQHLLPNMHVRNLVLAQLRAIGEGA